MAKRSAIEDRKAERKRVADRKAHGLKSLVVVLQYKAYGSSNDDDENESVQSLDSENSSVNFVLFR